MRGAAGAGRDPGRVDALRSRRPPRARPSSPPRATRGPRTATSPELVRRHRPRGGRPGQPALGDERGGDHARAPSGRRRPRRCGTSGLFEGHRRGRDLDAVDDAVVAARTGRAERLHQGRRLLHRGASRARSSSGRGHACRAGRCPTWPPTPTPAPGSPSSCSCGQRRVAARSAARAWRARCGRALAALADQGAVARPVGFLNPALYQASAQASRRLQRRHGRGTTSRPARRRAIPPGPRRARTTRPRPATTWPAGLGSPVAVGPRAPTCVTPPPSACPAVTAISSRRRARRRAGRTVTLSGANLAGVTEVDFGTGNAGAIEAVSRPRRSRSAPRRRPRAAGPRPR